MKKNIASHWTKTQIVAKDYIGAVLNHRTAQREFIAEVYLFRKNFINQYKNSQVPAEWKKFISRQFRQLGHRQPTKEEERKPYLALLHILLKRPNQKGEMIKCTKMAAALRVIEKVYKGNDSIGEVLQFIKEKGGVEKLYSIYRNVDENKADTIQKKAITLPTCEYGDVKVKVGGTTDDPKIKIEGVRAGKHRYDIVVDDDGYIVEIKGVKQGRPRIKAVA